MKALMIALGGVVLGVLASAAVLWPKQAAEVAVVADAEPEPLYWVAPMDPNYRRDGPGKSPMGMDLVPVYADADPDNAPGTVKVSSAVVNNLGVRTAPVTQTDWQSEIRTVGYVTYDEDRLLHIHPRVSGWVEKLYVKAAGDPVEQGQALYSLYSPELVNAQEELLIAVKRNNSALITAATERLRALQLDEDFIEKLRRRGKASQLVTFYASRSGVLNELQIREGFYVQPGTTMMSIGQLDEVWVEAEVFERQLIELQPGLAVTMTLDFLPSRQWHGQVDYVYPELDSKLRTARVRLRFANPDRLLKPNMFASVTIHGKPSSAVLTVPKEALIRAGSQNRVVRALGDGRFRSVAVDIGRSNASLMEVLGGLSAGDEVVTSGQFLLDSESSKNADFSRLEDPAEAGGGSMEHSEMDHSQMNHGVMDEVEMDHSQMDHGAMDEVEMPAEHNHD